MWLYTSEAGQPASLNNYKSHDKIDNNNKLGEFINIQIKGSVLLAFNLLSAIFFL